MNTRAAVLSLFLAVCCAAGRAQTAKPSITIGTHVLKLGMPESTVLEQLGSDFKVYPLPVSGQGAGSIWMVQKKTGSAYQLATGDQLVMGEVDFDASHRLVAATRYWDVEDTSSKSLFYAINEATQSLERDGLTACRISATGASQMIDAPSGGGSGSFDTKEIRIDCGIKQIRIELDLSDAPGIAPSQIEVRELLLSK